MTNNVKNLYEIAERCRMAMGPDRKLDAVIHAARWGANAPANVPEYSQSTTAAETLRPEGHHWKVAGSAFSTASIHDPDDEDYVLGEAEAITPALALCAASFLALLHIEIEGAP